jgi:hypothetical protein
MMNPEIISLHYTIKCEGNCPHCYLMKQKSLSNEIEKDEWLKLPSLLSSKDYIKKVAIALNSYKYNSTSMEEEYEFVLAFLSECNRNKFKLDITTDKNMCNYIINNDNNLFGIDVLSISVDVNRMEFEDIKLLSNLCKKIKTKGINSINANFLINKEWLDKGVLELLSSMFDTIHIIIQKPLNFTEDEFYNIIEKLLSLDIFENEKYIIDPCLLFKLGLISTCHNSKKIIDINPYGSISGCAYNHKNPIGIIKKVNDLLVILDNIDTKIVKKCTYLEFAELNENNKAKFRKSNSYQSEYS